MSTCVFPMQAWLQTKTEKRKAFIALLLLISFAAALLIFWPTVAGWDVSLLYTFQNTRIKAWDRFFGIVTDITTYITISILLAILLVAAIKRSSEEFRNAMIFLSAFTLAAIVSNSLKYLVGRERPFVTHAFIEQLSGGGSPSFPSGHTTEVFAVATILVLLYPRRRLVFIAFLWAAVVGYTRIAFGVHYPSDVIGAALLGTATSIGVMWMWYTLLNRRRA